MAGGELRNNQNVFKDPPSISSLKLGRTTLAKCFIVPDGEMPRNGRADFFKRLDAFLKNAPAQDAAGKERVALPRPKPKTGDTVRCFAVFECQAAVPCPCAERDFDVIATGSISDDPRPGHYHLWDECNGKDVYKKYGSEMCLYACHGQDLTIGKLHFDMFDLKEYSHGGAPVLKARGIDLYLFYEWYKQSGNDLGQGRWILAQKAGTSETNANQSAWQSFNYLKQPNPLLQLWLRQDDTSSYCNLSVFVFAFVSSCLACASLFIGLRMRRRLGA